MTELTTEQECDRLQLIVTIGIRMREAQKKYFKTRDRSDLVASKQLERQFDEACRDDREFMLALDRAEAR
jgi:hypothetical protein